MNIQEQIISWIGTGCLTLGMIAATSFIVYMIYAAIRAVMKARKE